MASIETKRIGLLLENISDGGTYYETISDLWKRWNW